MSKGKDSTREMFAWLNQIKADGDAGALLVAFEIGQHINRQTGTAWPSTQTIATGIDKSQPYVVKMVARLKERGHLEVEAGSPGHPGRGHSNRYRIIVKHNSGDACYPAKHKSGDASAKSKASQSEAESITIGEIKHHPGDENHKTNHKKNHKRAASPPTLPVFLESVTDDRERAYAALMAAYPNKTSHEDSRVEFYRLLNDGIGPDDLIAEAKIVAIKSIGKRPKEIDYLCYWLKVDALPSLEASRFLNMGREIGARGR
jgi:hypothetical protein